MSASGELDGVVVVDEVLEDGLLVEVDVVVLSGDKRVSWVEADEEQAEVVASCRSDWPDTEAVEAACRTEVCRG
jgi:uncharacterized membrane protein